MAPKKPKPATDSIIGRRVRINTDATYANGNTHAWAGFTGTVRVHNGRSVYQVEMEDGQAIEVFPLDSFSLLHDAHVDGQADGGVDASAGADQLATPTQAAAAADTGKPTGKSKGKPKTTPEEAQAAIAHAMQAAEANAEEAA